LEEYHGQTKRARLNFGASLGRLSMAGVYLMLGLQSKKEGYQREQDARDAVSGRDLGGEGIERKRAEYERNKAVWPYGASDDKFKQMYRRVSKKYHPDSRSKMSPLSSTESSARFIVAEEAYSTGNWGVLFDLDTRPDE
jgi:hypothetical protein